MRRRPRRVQATCRPRIAARVMDGWFGGAVSLSSIINPAVPCACEWLGGVADAPQERRLAEHDSVWELSVHAGGVAVSRYASPAAAAAAVAAAHGFGLPPAEAALAVARALALCADCGDAWNLKALRCAASLEEALAC